MSSLAISLYRLINDETLEKAGFDNKTMPVFTYTNEQGEEISINLGDETLYEYRINELDSKWTPELHDLVITQDFHFEHPSCFFGSDSVTGSSNKLGVAVHIHSRTSNFQETVVFGELADNSGPKTLSFETSFEKSKLRGVIDFDFFIFLMEVNSHGTFQAHNMGTRLTEESLTSYSLIVDGDGSMFPIVEVENAGGPVWSLEADWSDVLVDSFDTSNVRLKLNTKHKRYKDLTEEKNETNRFLMTEILSSAMALIVQKAIFEDDVEIEEMENAEPGSVGLAIWYWCKTFEIDLKSNISINDSFRKYFEMANK